MISGKNFKRLPVFLLLVLSFSAVTYGIFAQNGRSEFDQIVPVKKEPVTVAVFYPSVGTIKDLLTLRKERLIDIPDLAVLAVYHELEMTEYDKAKEYVKANRLDWVAFHPIGAPLSPENLFKKNDCSEEFKKIFDRVDGIIFFGGPDIPPYLYGEKTSLLTEITDPYRHFLETSFIFHLLGGYQDESFTPLLEQRPYLPIFGICLGCQSLAVGTGGALTQDIWSEIYGKSTLEEVIALGKEYWHTSPYAGLFPRKDLFRYAFHSIKLDAGGKFCRETGIDEKNTPYILSAHHQQIKKMGKGFSPLATSLDGKVVEAIEHGLYPKVLGVQFHPEMSNLYDPDYRVFMSPQEKQAVSLRSFLESDRPSWEFHQKIWSWVSRGWVESHRRRAGR
jgi:putative glutamine amidotransferase